MDDSYLNSAGKRDAIGLSFDISIQIEGGRSLIDWFDQLTEKYFTIQVKQAVPKICSCVSLIPLLWLQKHSTSIESKEFLIIVQLVKKSMIISQTVMPIPFFFILNCLKVRCGKVKPLLFFSEVSILVFFHFWTRTCSITTRFKLISFLSNYKAYCILLSPCKKGVLEICITKYQHVKIWWWQVDSVHQNFVTFSVVQTCVHRQTFSRSSTSHIFIMRWNRWSEYPYFLIVLLQQSEFAFFPPGKTFITQLYQQFFLLKGTSINFSADLFSKVSRMVLGHIKPPTQRLPGALSH